MARYNIEIIRSDLKILYDATQGDSSKDYYFNAINHCDEFNRILAVLKHHCPDKVSDIDEIQISPISLAAFLQGSLLNRDISIFHKIVQEVAKVYNRIIGSDAKALSTAEPLSILERICNRFHYVASQLTKRYSSRPTINIEDEYDVQDLMHALLKLYFDDIRHEEWTPSYAGSSNRMDFLLKSEKIVVEAKKTRKNLRDKEIGDELIVDHAHYKQHADCETLVCFVYDPDRILSNPKALGTDLSALSSDRLTVKVFIAPN